MAETSLVSGDPAVSGEGRLRQRRLIRLGVAIALVGITIGSALGARLRLQDFFFVLAILALMAYYEEWVVHRKWAGTTVLAVGLLCVIAVLVSDFA